MEQAIIIEAFEEAIDTLEREARNMKEGVIHYESTKEALEFFQSYVVDVLEIELDQEGEKK